MKKVLLLLFLGFSLQGIAQITGPPTSCIPLGTSGVGDPYVGCFGELDRYLARSIEFAGLPNLVGTSDYCDQMNLISDLLPGFLTRVAGGWGTEESDLLPGGTGYNKALQVIKDVNKIYDHKQVRRPLIEGKVYEAITDQINLVAIPAYVHAAFASDNDYINAGYVTNPPATFDYDKIRNLGMTSWGTTTGPPPITRYKPDIDRIQTRMWYYYLSTVFINMGCRCVGMDWFDLAFQNDQPLYSKTHDLFNKIRSYATSQGTFVVIGVNRNYAVYHNNTNQLIADFLYTPLRAEPTYNPYTFQGYNTSPCSGEAMAELDFSVLQPEVLTNQGGVSPTGCNIETTPILFNIDWFGVGYTGLIPPNTPIGDGYSPWSVNETIWFSLFPDDCQAYMLKNMAYAIKNDIVSRGYLKIPGIADLTWWGAWQGGFPEHYILKDHPTVVNALAKEIWKPNEKTYYTITKKCMPDCNGDDRQHHILKVADPDITSIYTWHIFNVTANTWLPHSYGNERDLIDLTPGTYKITLRQENIYFPWNTELIMFEKEIKVEENNCRPRKDGHKKLEDVDNRAKIELEEKAENIINKPAMTDDLSVYPNPAQNVLKIDFNLSKAEKVSMKMTDISGRVVKDLMVDVEYSKGNHIEQLEVGELVNGSYLLVFRANGRTVAKEVNILR